MKFSLRRIADEGNLILYTQIDEDALCSEASSMMLVNVNMGFVENMPLGFLLGTPDAAPMVLHNPRFEAIASGARHVTEDIDVDDFEAESASELIEIVTSFHENASSTNLTTWANSLFAVTYSSIYVAVWNTLTWYQAMPIFADLLRGLMVTMKSSSIYTDNLSSLVDKIENPTSWSSKYVHLSATDVKYALKFIATQYLGRNTDKAKLACLQWVARGLLNACVPLTSDGFTSGYYMPDDDDGETLQIVSSLSSYLSA